MLSAILLGTFCILVGFGSKQTSAEQAVLSAFKQGQTGENAETASASGENLQDQMTVSGNTIGQREIDLETELDEVFRQVNEIRKEAGQTELVWSDDLADAAGIRAKEIHVTFSHTRPDGSEWWSVNENLVYGENLARGYQSADSVMKAWLASAEHKDNILYSDFQSIGIAVYKVDGKWYWVQEFGY